MDPETAQDLTQFIDGRFQGCADFKAAFPGDLHFGRAPAGTPLPYLVVNLVGEAPVLHTEDDTGEGAVVRFAAFAASIPEARRLCTLLARHPDAGLDRVAGASLDGQANEAVVTAQRTGGASVLDDEAGESGGDVWMGMLTYTFFFTRGA